ncbi:permease prefix domain 1-containing protein [Micromonospora sp. DT47]|uniref:permease prefix domain 1-containing protein n=1 Tax=Micromonospora sp. DT47 TaxID=3393431 RepID=UPI003CF48B2B
MASDRVSTPAGEARLDAYLSDLAARLRGPRRRREQILAELRDGLDHAIIDHTTAGLPEGDAVSAAIAQFGNPQAVAEAFSGELATAYARRTIACYIATGPLVGIWWFLLLQPHPWRTGLIALLAAIPVIPLIIIAIAIAVGTFATTGRLMRWLPEASPQHALAATVTIAALALAGDVTVIAIYLRSEFPAQSLAAFAIAASLTRITFGLVTMRQATTMHHVSLTADRPTPTPTEDR